MARATNPIEITTKGGDLPFDDFLFASLGWFEGPGLETDVDTDIVAKTTALLISQFQET